MTDDFIKKVHEANEQAVKRHKKQDEKSLKEKKQNEKYINMYQDLVLTFIEAFDYKTGEFDIGAIDKDLTETIGYPEEIFAYINDDVATASICLHYKRQGYKLFGLPSFIEKGIIDFDVVNLYLNENEISVTEDLWDGGEGGSDDYIIDFDASILLSTRTFLLEDQGKSKSLI